MSVGTVPVLVSNPLLVIMLDLQGKIHEELCTSNGTALPILKTLLIQRKGSEV